MNLISVITDVEREFPGWIWLVRNNDDRAYPAYFANISNHGDPSWPEEGVSNFPTWGATPEAALWGAFEKVRRTHQ